MASWADDKETPPVSRTRRAEDMPTHMKPPSIDVEKLAGHEALSAAFPMLQFKPENLVQRTPPPPERRRVSSTDIGEK
jgi:hypothetical protein